MNLNIITVHFIEILFRTVVTGKQEIKKSVFYGVTNYILFWHRSFSKNNKRWKVKMLQNKREVGANYEKIAGEYLILQGYEIIEYNFYSRIGEIDIVAKHNGYLVFVEVKYRENEEKGHPLEAISLKKQRSISKCAFYYMQKNHLHDVSVRFDVVAILGEEIQVVQNAFDFIM
jgi:putative endonuclease